MRCSLRGPVWLVVAWLAAGCTVGVLGGPAPPTGPPPAGPAPVTGPAPTTGAALATGPAPAPGGTLPDAAFTPGETDPAVTAGTIGQTICVSGWTATVRPPATYTEEVKRLQAGAGGTVAYGPTRYPVHGFRVADHQLGDFELDHLVPLELGGDPADPRNLWLEPYEAPRGPAAAGSGSQTKDRVDNAAREAVCTGRLALAAAQQQMAANWVQLGRQLGVVR